MIGFMIEYQNGINLKRNLQKKNWQRLLKYEGIINKLFMKDYIKLFKLTIIIKLIYIG